MNKKQEQDFIYIASCLEWCDLADEIISLEYERNELLHTVGKKHYIYKHISKALEIFEQEKERRVREEAEVSYTENFPIPF